jgi:hypothetical protein
VKHLYSPKHEDKLLSKNNHMMSVEGPMHSIEQPRNRVIGPEDYENDSDNQKTEREVYEREEKI